MEDSTSPHTPNEHAGASDRLNPSGALDVGRRVNAERIVLLSWSRAILLQLAHPLVAAGVAGHSTFRGSRMAAASRLHQTVRAMLALTFGDDTMYARGIAGIRAIHVRVHGELHDTIGPFPAGTRYSAEDPDLLLWVHATLLESVPLAYEALVGPLSATDRDAYCAQAARVAIDLGARAGEVPRTWEALTSYLDKIHRSGCLVVGPDARTLAEAVLSPPLATLAWPIVGVNRLYTAGSLPERLREQYGLAWSARHARRLARTMQMLRAMRRVLPRAIAWWPDARKLPSI